MNDCTICEVKTKTLSVVTAQLICIFPFTYADFWHSDAAAHLFYSLYFFYLEVEKVWFGYNLTSQSTIFSHAWTYSHHFLGMDHCYGELLCLPQSAYFFFIFYFFLGWGWGGGGAKMQQI